MAKKRGNNEGSIYQRDSGLWRAQISIDGNRLSFSGKTQRECREWIQSIQNQIAEGSRFSDLNLTFGDYLINWLASIEPNIRQTTYVQYSQITRDCIEPAMGSIRLKEVKPVDVQSFYNKCKVSGVSDRSVRMIHTVLHRSLS